jgi:hypothetical protein
MGLCPQARRSEYNISEFLSQSGFSSGGVKDEEIEDFQRFLGRRPSYTLEVVKGLKI